MRYAFIMDQPFEVRRLGRTFFAEVLGLDLARQLDEATFARVKQAISTKLPSCNTAAFRILRNKARLSNSG